MNKGKSIKKRDGLKIFIWMKRNGLTYTSISRDLGYSSHVPVWRTINGEKSLRKVLAYLQDKGCPNRMLCLPKDMVNKQ